tara:strand:+ start:11 stop:259 length:249 start_codon:yes stop_codon:yes gene_type:complete
MKYRNIYHDKVKNNKSLIWKGASQCSESNSSSPFWGRLRRGLKSNEVLLLLVLNVKTAINALINPPVSPMMGDIMRSRIIHD